MSLAIQSMATAPYHFNSTMSSRKTTLANFEDIYLLLLTNIMYKCWNVKLWKITWLSTFPFNLIYELFLRIRVSSSGGFVCLFVCFSLLHYPLNRTISWSDSKIFFYEMAAKTLILLDILYWFSSKFKRNKILFKVTIQGHVYFLKPVYFDKHTHQISEVIIWQKKKSKISNFLIVSTEVSSTLFKFWF